MHQETANEMHFFRSISCFLKRGFLPEVYLSNFTPSFHFQDGADVGPITKVVSHPTLPLTITAHEDRHIRFFDNSTGKQTHVMVAHLDAVTSLSVDTNGLYLISGSTKSL